MTNAAHDVARRLAEHHAGMVLTVDAALQPWQALRDAHKAAVLALDAAHDVTLNDDNWVARNDVLARTQSAYTRAEDAQYRCLAELVRWIDVACAQQGQLLDQAADLLALARDEAFGRAPIDLGNPALSARANNVSDVAPFAERIGSTFG
jgi:hypothetical protein